MTDPPVPEPAWRESLSDHKLKQADRITSAAIELVFEHGVSALSMSAIAQAAGVSRQTLYKYFPDVAAILRAAVQRSEDHDTAMIEQAETPRAQLVAFVRWALSAAQAGHPSPSALQPVLAPDVRAELEAHAAHVKRLVALIVQRGVDEGEFRPDLDPDLDGELVYRTVLAAHDLVAEGDHALVAEHVERAVLSMVLR